MAKLNLWDTHAHLDDPQFDNDRDQLLPQLGETLAGIINPAVDLESCEKIVQLTEQSGLYRIHRPQRRHGAEHGL